MQRVVEFIGACARTGTYNTLLERDAPHLASCISPEEIRAAADRFSYSDASRAHRDRHLGNVILIDILEQKFHSYRDMGCSILRQLAEPTVFAALNAGHVILSVGDYPKQNMQRTFIDSGHNHPDGPIHLARLLDACNPAMFARALAANGLLGDPDGALTLAKAAMNIFQVQGPLHCRINPTKDFGAFFRDIMVMPLYVLIHNRKTKPPEQLRLREVAGILQILLAAWRKIRLQALECLMPIANRFDAATILWAMESTLPQICLAYDGVFKAGMHELYVESLGHLEITAILQQRKNYKFSLLLKAAQILYLLDHDHPLRTHCM